MGKIKRQRNKLHLARNNVFPHFSADPSLGTSDSSKNLSLSEGYDNIFAGVNISMDTLRNFDDDARSVVSTSKSIYKGVNSSKEERRKLRHKTFIERILAIQSLRNKKPQLNSKKKLSHTNDTLLPGQSREYVSGESEKMNELLQRKGIRKSKERQKCLLKDMATLLKVWQNPDFKADPTGFVGEMIQERILHETGSV